MTHLVCTVAEKIQPWLVETRRRIHMNPEMAFEEVETAGFVAESLANWGIGVQCGVARTGVIGLLDTGRPGPTLGIRADMDALPIQEVRDVPYKSRRKGVMHACGHDAHTTMLLGAARILAENPALLDGAGGQVKFLFQPGEEGRAGGRMMVEEGVLEDPRVDLVLAAHVYPAMSSGTIGTHTGPTMGSGDKFLVTLRGASSHAAYPHNARDPILAAGHIITALQSVVSRNVDPFDSAVVSVTQMEAGVAINIVPEEVRLNGTIRSIRPEVREMVKERVADTIRGVASAFGVEADVDIQEGYPSLINHEGATALIEKSGGDILGGENVLPAPLSLGSEDFAFIAQQRPAAMFRLGIRNEEAGIVHGLHSNYFDVDENVLQLGVSIFVQAVREFLMNSEHYVN